MQSYLLYTWQQFVVESVNDRLTYVLRLHADEADAATDAVGWTKNTRGHDGTEAGEHHLQVFLGRVHRQVGNVQIGIIAFLLLETTITAWCGK